jgi:acetyltransferase-like isoleucine patch superfamily enzyme
MNLSFVIRLLFRGPTLRQLEAQLDRLKVLRCLEWIMIGPGSQFYPEARVNNMQGKKEKIRIGSNTHIRGHLQIFTQGGDIQIGDFCYIGENSYVWSAGSVKIGDRVLVAHNVNIHDNISHPVDVDARYNDYKRILGLEKFDAKEFDLKPLPVEISDDVWIGFNSTILKGVKIGKGAIIGANTFVTEDVAPFTIVVGNPQRVMKNLES